jgi:hypothetical protein
MRSNRIAVAALVVGGVVVVGGAEDAACVSGAGGAPHALDSDLAGGGVAFKRNTARQIGHGSA